MNSVNAHTFGRFSLVTTATVFVLWVSCAAYVRAESQVQLRSAPVAAVAEADSGNAMESLGEPYARPQMLHPKLARVTLYRPVQGFEPGVAHIDINGHYHTSLQLGGYSEMCVEPAEFTLASHMVQGDVEPQNNTQVDAIKFTPQAAQNAFVRVLEHGNGRATLLPVKPEVAHAELDNTRRQIHAISRLGEDLDCVESAPRLLKKESIVLGADDLFGVGQAGINGISAQGRQSLDALMAHVQKEYGESEKMRFHITGHADPLGSAIANKRLSQARANAVRSYMLNGGLSAQSLTSEGMGSEQLAVNTCGATATTETIECNKPNRRVVVSVYQLVR